MNFDTKLLEGKVKEDPDQGQSIKPVSSMHPCLYMGVLGNDWNIWVIVGTVQVVLWDQAWTILRTSAFSCMGGFLVS